MIRDVFWHWCSSVCSRIGQRHRAQQVDIAQIGPGHYGNLFLCVQRPVHPVSPHSVVHRLAGARYQLDGYFVQAGIVDNGRNQEDPVVGSCDRYPHTDAICRNVQADLRRMAFNAPAAATA